MTWYDSVGYFAFVGGTSRCWALPSHHLLGPAFSRNTPSSGESGIARASTLVQNTKQFLKEWTSNENWWKLVMLLNEKHASEHATRFVPTSNTHTPSSSTSFDVLGRPLSFLFFPATQIISNFLKNWFGSLDSVFIPWRSPKVPTDLPSLSRILLRSFFTLETWTHRWRSAVQPVRKKKFAFCAIVDDDKRRIDPLAIFLFGSIAYRME